VQVGNSPKRRRWRRRRTAVGVSWCCSRMIAQHQRAKKKKKTKRIQREKRRTPLHQLCKIHMPIVYTYIIFKKIPLKQKKPKNPSKYYNSITENLKFQHKPKYIYIIFQTSSYKIQTYMGLGFLQYTHNSTNPW
jgi:hypothetical protein